MRNCVIISAMESKGIFTFNVRPEQHAALTRLQEKYADVCNEISQVVVRTACWSRVGLHQMLYRKLRQKYPELGSQMICNAIHCVAKTSKQNYQSKHSPCYSLVKTGIIPKIIYSKNIPLYFDKNTLSISGDLMTLFTLEGRIRFKVGIPLDIKEKFLKEGVREIILNVNTDSCDLIFCFMREYGESDDNFLADFTELVLEKAA